MPRHFITVTTKKDKKFVFDLADLRAFGEDDGITYLYFYSDTNIMEAVKDSVQDIIANIYNVNNY